MLGAPLSGKSYLSEFIAHSHFEADSCFHINPTPNGSIDLLEFHRSIKKGLKYYGDIHAAFDHLAQDSVLVFHDAEKWWERSEHGFRVLDSLLDLIERYSRRVLFLVNMNIHSFHLINNIRVIEESFFKVVNTRPFNAEELKHIILSRHRTSKLKFRLEGRHEDSLSEWRLAKHFTKYFDLSGGNVGVALQQWICHIQGIASNGEITIIPAKRPDPEILTGIDRDRVIILIQFVLHKQLSMERLSRIMQTDPQELVKQIEVLYRLDFLREKNGVWEINRFLQPFLIEALKEDLLL